MDELGSDPKLAGLLADDPDWLDVLTVNPEIMTAISTAKVKGTVFVAGPQTLTRALDVVQTTMVAIKAPASLLMETKKAMARRLLETDIDLGREDIEKFIEFKIELAHRTIRKKDRIRRLKSTSAGPY